jgi:penicillin G amidase
MKTVLKLALAVLLVALAVAGGMLWWLAGPTPPEEGRLHLPGLKALVTVARDDLGIPRIVAANTEDAYFVLGYLHAQDRLWQMETQRRVGAGRMAEIMGDRALSLDKFMRTLGLYHLAEDSYTHLAPEVQQALSAYAAGVNAWLAKPTAPLPPEFYILRYSPEPWKPADTLVWARLMALQLSGNWTDELRRARLSATLPADQVADLWPAVTETRPANHSLEDSFIDRMLAAVPQVVTPRLASNMWVVSGDHSATGKPILANDPHLEFQAPTLWYLATISTPELELSGGTVPGVPFHLLGHNRRCAWGITTTHSDTMDLFIEKPAGDGYLTPQGKQAFRQHAESIRVRGGDPVTITVRETRHGPVVSDVLGERAQGQLLALSAAALEPDDRTAQAMYRLNRASDWNSFVAALEDFHSPQQNLTYADVDGHIGAISPGRVPIRKSGDGTLPRPGWTGEYDWTGWVPFDALPRQFDPPSGILVNANNKVVDDDYPYLLAVTWPEPYRAQRIREVLESRPQHSVADMAALQMDQLSPLAEQLKPLLLKTAPRNARGEAAYAMLKAWNNVADASRPEPLVFEAWVNQLQQELLTPWLGTYKNAFPTIHPEFLKAVLNGRTVWCGGPGQPVPNICDGKVADALDHALDVLTRRYGEDMASWQWGEAHPVVFDALLFRYIPVLAPMTRLSAPVGGDDFTVQRGTFVERTPGFFPNLHGAGMRAVYDLSDLAASRFVISTGQSGNPLSSHWGDFLELWRKGESITLPQHHPPANVQLMLPGAAS